ncbi:MAG: hypothetical protein ACOC7J_06925 [Armatimonadota bacterium]
MDAILGSIFQTLTRIGGGSELVPLLVFCVFVVLVGLGLGMGAMRLLRPRETQSKPEE